MSKDYAVSNLNQILIGDNKADLLILISNRLSLIKQKNLHFDKKKDFFLNSFLKPILIKELRELKQSTKLF